MTKDRVFTATEIQVGQNTFWLFFVQKCRIYRQLKKQRKHTQIIK